MPFLFGKDPEYPFHIRLMFVCYDPPEMMSETGEEGCVWDLYGSNSGEDHEHFSR